MKKKNKKKKKKSLLPSLVVSPLLAPFYCDLAIKIKKSLARANMKKKQLIKGSALSTANATR